jgi:GTP-binding protein YchF
MQVALIGLTQSGKTTLFSAITEGHVHAGAGAAHIADKEIVKVPDERLAVLSDIYKPKKTTNATIEFLDLPGLDFTSESGRQEARRIIANARQSDMLVVIVRDFTNESVASYRGRIKPDVDIEELKGELVLADLELVANRIDRLEKSISKPSKVQETDKRELALMQKCREKLEELQPLSEAIDNPEEEKLVRSFGFLTLKPMCIVLNVNEDKLDKAVELPAEQKGEDAVVMSAKLEAELAALDAEERAVFLEDMGINEIARDRLIKMCYQKLRMVSFLTVGPDEVRAWTIPADCHAVEAAGEIHSDIQRGFIRAETVSYDDFIAAAGDMKAAKAAGKVRLEGKTYPVQDGDIINFRFNV